MEKNFNKTAYLYKQFIQSLIENSYEITKDINLVYDYSDNGRSEIVGTNTILQVESPEDNIKVEFSITCYKGGFKFDCISSIGVGWTWSFNGHWENVQPLKDESGNKIFTTKQVLDIVLPVMSEIFGEEFK